MTIPNFWSDLLLSANPGEAIQSPIRESLPGGPGPIGTVTDEFAVALYRRGIDEQGCERIKADFYPVPPDATSREVACNLADLISTEMQYEITLWLFEDEQDCRVLMTVHRTGPDAVEINTFSWAENSTGWQSLGSQQLERMDPSRN